MLENRPYTYQIQIPEGVVFSYQLAGPVVRFLAWLVDFFCIAVLTKVFCTTLSLLAILSQDVAVGLQLLVFFVLNMVFNIPLEGAWRGQTLGKRLFRLRVIDAQGLALQWPQVIVRNLLRLVDNLPLFYMVGGLSCLASRRAQRLGDIIAHTIVIRLPLHEEPDLSQIPSGKFNSFRAYPHLAARLRQSVSPEEASLALEGLLQREKLDPQARLELYRSLADHFRGKVSFPDELTEGLSDEQYLRNVVDITMRSKSA